MLADTFGRVATDLRVSLTDRCNLRCSYCMPRRGPGLAATPELLTDDEVVRLVSVAVDPPGRRRGPLHRRRAAAAPRPGRHRRAYGAADAAARDVADDERHRPRPAGRRRSQAAGLDRVNVAPRHARPDTVHRRSPAATGSTTCWPGSRRRTTPASTPVKVNAVLMRGVNDDEARRLLRSCLERGYELRFIEQMPLDAQHGWDRATMVTADEILDLLDAGSTSRRRRRRRGAVRRRSRSWSTAGRGPVGIIASVTRPFCGDCDRVRLTADGQVRNCLFARDGVRPADGAAGRRADEPSWPTAGARALREQAARPRHRRPELPAAHPADVRDRRLTAIPAQSGNVLFRVRTSVGERPTSRRNAARAEEVGQAVACVRRRPARSCAGRACGSSGCSTAAPRSPAARIPWRSRPTGCLFGHRRAIPPAIVADHSIIKASGRNEATSDSHGGSRPTPHQVPEFHP